MLSFAPELSIKVRHARWDELHKLLLQKKKKKKELHRAPHKEIACSALQRNSAEVRVRSPLNGVLVMHSASGKAFLSLEA